MPSDTRPKSSKPSVPPKFEAREIALSKLLEPSKPSRQTFDEIKLQELIESIRSVGLIEPLVVFAEGSKFRIHAGHRRFLACRALQMDFIPCVVRDSKLSSGEAVTVHENVHREELNSAEEAVYFAQLLEEQCGGDVDKLCDLVRCNRPYVENRLLLFQGEPKVLEALGAAHISIGVAQELNKVVDAGMRLVYLDAAIRGGASISLVRDWRVKANLLYSNGTIEPGLQNPSPEQMLSPVQLDCSCFFCGDDKHVYAMELVYLHRYCRQALEAMANKNASLLK